MTPIQQILRRAGKPAALCALCASLAILPTSCASNGASRDDTADAGDDIRLPLGRSGKSDGPEYTANTLLISLNEGSSEDEVYALAERYGMEVMYIYQNFNMCAVKLPRDYSDAEFKDLIRQLKKEPIVNDVSRDAIMHLYG
jgi:hypothetical protein